MHTVIRNKLTNQLNDLTAKLDSAIEAAKRAEEIKSNQEFYRLQLPPSLL